MNPKFQTHQIALPPELAGRRLDQALAQLLPQYSRTRIQRWIEEGAVRVNGLAARARDVVVGGETAPVEARLPPETGVAAEKLPLDIVHEDAAVIVLNKAPGVVVHPGAGNREHTLQNALLAHDAKLKRVPRAGLVHRIDKDTSGLLVVARTLEAQTALVAALAAHEVEREYLALCTGVMTGGGTVDQPIGRHRTQRTRWRCAVTAARRSRTTASRSAFARTRWRECASRPGARTRSACTWRTWVIPSSATRCMAGGVACRRAPRRAEGGARRLSPPGAACRAAGIHAPEERQDRDIHGAAARGLRGVVRRAGARCRGVTPVSDGLLSFEWTLAARRARSVHHARGGASLAPWDSFNLGVHVGDDPAAVAANRAQLAQLLATPSEPSWLNQVHGTEVVDLDARLTGRVSATADASIATLPGRVCVVMVADCLPGVVRQPRRPAHCAPRMRGGAAWPQACSNARWLRSTSRRRSFRPGSDPPSHNRISKWGRRCARPSLAPTPAPRPVSAPMLAAAGRRIWSGLARRRLAAIGVRR